ncbi:unnamed protein product, partial [Ectocarpus sp. 12 AP-2014]
GSKRCCLEGDTRRGSACPYQQALDIAHLPAVNPDLPTAVGMFLRMVDSRLYFCGMQPCALSLSPTRGSLAVPNGTRNGLVCPSWLRTRALFIRMTQKLCFELTIGLRLLNPFDLTCPALLFGPSHVSDYNLTPRRTSEAEIW